MFLLNFIGFFSGRTVDSGYFRLSLGLGCTFQVIGVFATAFSTQYWQLFLAQGICSGLGHGFLFAPIVSILPTYFKKNRAVAVSLATCGASTGGMVFPIIAYFAMPRLGFRWTVIIMGCVVTFNAIMVFFFTRTRVVTRKPRSLFDFRAFTELPYTLFAIGSFLVLWGIYFAYFYVCTQQNSRIWEQKALLTFQDWDIRTFRPGLLTDRVPAFHHRHERSGSVWAGDSSTARGQVLWDSEHSHSSRRHQWNPHPWLGRCVIH